MIYVRVKSIGAIRTSRDGHVDGSPARLSRPWTFEMRARVHLSFSEQQMRRANHRRESARRRREARVGVNRVKN